MDKFYDIDFNLQTDNLINPLHRAKENMDYISSITNELQYLRDILLGDYKDGCVYPLYDSGTAYTAGNRVTISNKAVYERRYIDNAGAVIGSTTGIAPSGAVLSSATWRKINDNYIGIDERKQYNGQLIVLTNALNKWFEVSGAPYIYMVNNDFAGLGFTLYCPLAVYNALGSTNPDRENAIRQFIDKFAIAGIVYLVLTY